MSTDVVERLDRISVKADLQPRDLARVFSTDPRTVTRWLDRETVPRSTAQERLLELEAVVMRLSGVLEPHAVHDWLLTPNAQLDHHKPIELLSVGEYRPVLAAIDAMAEGVFVEASEGSPGM